MFRSADHDEGPLEGLLWGLCHVVDGQGGYMQRFGVDETLKTAYLRRQAYECPDVGSVDRTRLSLAGE